MKQCSICKEYKDDVEFYTHINTKDGMYGYCKKCHNKRSLEWQKNNPEKHKENIKRYSQKNKDKLKKYYREYFQRPEVKARQREYMRKYMKEHRTYTYTKTKPIEKSCHCCSKRYTTVQYHQRYCSKTCRQRIRNRRKEKGSRKKLKWKTIYPNPLHKTEQIHYHHITPEHVIPLPKDIHLCYAGYHTRYDNEDLDYIIEQIYPSFKLIKNSLRKRCDN